MFDFLKIQYELGKITKEQLYSYVPTWISEFEYKKIIGEMQPPKNDIYADTNKTTQIQLL